MNLQIRLLVALAGIFALSAAAQTNTFPASGNVGIGTTNPLYSLDINGSLNALSYAGPLVATPNGGISTPTLGLSDTTVFDRMTHFDGYHGPIPNSPDNSWWEGSLTIGDATRGIQITGGYDTGNLYFRKGNNGWQGWTLLLPATNVQYSGGNVGIGTTTPGAKLEVNGAIKLTQGTSGAAIIFADGTTQTTAWAGSACGGDYAESVDVTGDRKHYQPGDVLVIDPDAPGKFLKSAEPYSMAVAGIYSTKPGYVGRRQTTPKSPDEVPMAMVGIVPTKVSAENGAIRPGDILVTSSKLGYAMKGTDRTRLIGAVVGKALGKLDSGTGTIEVLVSLQ